MLRCGGALSRQASGLLQAKLAGRRALGASIITNAGDQLPAAEPRPAPSNPNLVEISIDGQKVTVEKGITILEAAAQAGIEIPRFCYHDRLSVAGNCRMCLVEVEKSIKPVASCAMPVMGAGMVIRTNSDYAKKAREGVMEFLLKNHPLDCPICDQGGECDLQDQSMTFGSDKSRLQVELDPKRSVEDKNVGTLVKTIMTRCIHCTRCVRFMSEVAGCEDFGTTGRGEQMQIGTYLENTVLLSELSGNIVDLCPVGALTSKPYAFTARPWELRRMDSVDVMDAVGSNIVVCSRSGDLLRILPRLNEDVNEEWLADKARHAPIDGLKNQRLTVPLVRPSRSSALQQCDWEDGLIIVSNAISSIATQKPSNLTAVVGPMVDAETMVALKDLFNSLGSENLYFHVDSALDASAIPSGKYLDFRSNYLFNTSIAGLEDDVDFVLLIGANPRFEAPLVNARLRKLWRSNVLSDIASIGPKDADLLYDYKWFGDDAQVISQTLQGNNDLAKQLQAAKKPIIILGQQILKSGDGKTSTGIYEQAKSLSEKFGAQLNVLHANASQVAAMDLGFRPSSELQGAGSDEQSLLWLFGVDDAGLPIGENTFTIYTGHNGDVGVEKADVVLPSAAFTEKQAIYANLEGRSQQTMKAVSAPALARDDWKIVRACSELVNRTLPYDNLGSVRDRLAELSPNLASPSYVRLQPAIPAVRYELKPSAGAGKLQTKLRALVDYYQTDAISRSSPTMAKCIVSVQKELDKRTARS